MGFSTSLRHIILVLAILVLPKMSLAAPFNGGVYETGGGQSFNFVTGDMAATGDFDGVNGPDLVITNYAGDTVSVLLNNGDGNFNASNVASLPTGAKPVSVAVGDFDGVKGPDLAVANSVGGTVSVLLNDGVGGFTAKVDYPVGITPSSVSVGDVNGDGKLDLVVANSGSGDVSILLNLNNGTGNFDATQPPYITGTIPKSVRLGDLDNDNDLDLVVANFGDDNVSVLLNDGTGMIFTMKNYNIIGDGATMTHPNAVTVGDVDGMYGPDLVVTNFGNNTVSILLNDGTGNFPAEKYFATGINPSLVKLGDFDELNGLDLAVVNYGSKSVSVLLNDGTGTGTFLRKVDYTTGANSQSVAVGDFDGVNGLDLAVAITKVPSDVVSMLVLLNNTKGDFTARSTYTTGTSPQSVAVGDLDGDNDLDLAVANFIDNTVSVLRNNNDGTYAAEEVYSTQQLGAKSVAVGDFDNDNDLDIVVANETSNTVSVLLNQGNAIYVKSADYETGTGPVVSLTVGDFDGDNSPDLAVVNSGIAGNVSVLLNNGDSTGTFAIPSPSPFPVGSFPTSVAAGDFDGNNSLDLVVIRTASNKMSVLLNDGTGKYPAYTEYSLGLGTSPIAVAVGDFDGNNSPDLAVVNAGNNTVSMFSNIGNGTGSFNITTSPYATGISPGSVAVGNFDGLNGLDLAVVNSVSDTVSMLLNKGDGSFAPKVDYATGMIPLSLVVGDFDGVNGPDLVVLESGDNTVSVLLNLGGITPTLFSFVDQVDALLGSDITSEAIAITGLGVPSPISIAGGIYSINGGAFTSSVGFIRNNDSLEVRVTTSQNNSITVNAVVTIGGVSDTFSVTTIADTEPDSFAFTDVFDVALNTAVISSDYVTITGITAASPISITGGKYSINEAPFTANTGYVNYADTIRVRVTASNEYATPVYAEVIIGGVSGTFSVTTNFGDKPDSFSFIDQTEVELGEVVTSDPVTITGIGTESSIIIFGGEYNINGGAFTSSQGLVVNEDRITVKVTASGLYNSTTINATVNAIVWIGGEYDTFSVTTIHDINEYKKPNDFFFNPDTVDGVAIGSLVTSNEVTITGVGEPVSVNVGIGNNGPGVVEYSINGKPFISVDGLDSKIRGLEKTHENGFIFNKDRIRIRTLSSSDGEKTVTAYLNLGEAFDEFNITTMAGVSIDTKPESFPFRNKTGAELNQTVTSDSHTITGIGAGATSQISITNGMYRIDGGAPTSSVGYISNGQNVRVVVTASDQYSTTETATVKIGGVSETFSVTTIAIAELGINKNPGVAAADDGGGGGINLPIFLGLYLFSFYYRRRKYLI